MCKFALENFSAPYRTRVVHEPRHEKGRPREGPPVIVSTLVECAQKAVI